MAIAPSRKCRGCPAPPAVRRRISRRYPRPPCHWAGSGALGPRFARATACRVTPPRSPFSGRLHCHVPPRVLASAAVVLGVDEPVAAESRTARGRRGERAVREVAGYLGNTPTVCRASYIAATKTSAAQWWVCRISRPPRTSKLMCRVESNAPDISGSVTSPTGGATGHQTNWEAPHARWGTFDCEVGPPPVDFGPLPVVIDTAELGTTGYRAAELRGAPQGVVPSPADLRMDQDRVPRDACFARLDTSQSRPRSSSRTVPRRDAGIGERIPS